MAIEADARWRGGEYPDDDGPAAGLAAARALAMITYRSAGEFAGRFGRTGTESPGGFLVEQYLRRHGDRLVARFDAESYVALTHTMDLHDVGDVGEAAAATARRVRHLVGVGIDTDILYAPEEVRDWVQRYADAGAPASYSEIRSPVGHDAFLVDVDQVAAILQNS
jgi:homoserine O-acetyltransferase